MVTRRTSERRFFLRPSKEVNQAIEYCLARALKRSGVRLHTAVFLSNHYHLIVTDPNARLPVFIEELNKLLARCLNCHFGRWENFWAGGAQTSCVELAEPGDVLAKTCYAILNPVVAGLVKSWRDWPGVIRVQPGTCKATRPAFFFRSEEEGGALPEHETYDVEAPPIADKPGTSMRLVHDMVRAFQEQIVVHRNRKGLRFLGAAAIRRQSPWDCPDSHAPRRQIALRVACRDKWRRIEVLGEQREFVDQHRECRARWERGERHVVFPAGTYLMRVRHGARCHRLAEA